MMDLDLVKAIQVLGNPLFDWLFTGVTTIGGEVFFIILVAVVYWTTDKKFAHMFALAYMASALVNTVTKGIFERARPYTHPGVEVPIESLNMTDGYSFPSGHSQAAGVIGMTAFEAKRRTALKIFELIGLIVIVLVPLSRVYLGQHYVTDVVTGLALGLGIALLVFVGVKKMGDKEHLWTLLLVPLAIIAFLLTRTHDVGVATGGLSGFAIGYYFEKTRLGYDVRAPFKIQLLKVLIGLIGVIAVKEGFKVFYDDNVYLDFIRYMMIGGWATFGAPYVFGHVFRRYQKTV